MTNLTNKVSDINRHIDMGMYNSRGNTKVVKMWCLIGGRLIVQVNIEDKWLQLRCLSLKDNEFVKETMGAGTNRLQGNIWTDLCLVEPELKFEHMIFLNNYGYAIDEHGELWIFYGDVKR